MTNHQNMDGRTAPKARRHNPCLTESVNPLGRSHSSCESGHFLAPLCFVFWWLTLLSAFGSVDVKANGAAGDGSTDDTAAIQSTIDGANGDEIVLPPGSYRI